MSIIRYQILRLDGTAAHEWLSTDHGADYYEPCFGTQAWTEQVPVLDADGNPVLGPDGLPTYGTPIQHPATFAITATDLTNTPQDPRWAALRTQRDQLLDGTKWLQGRHLDEQALGIATTLSAGTYTQWLQYWQALRALPDAMLQSGADPLNPTWPTQPPVKG